MVIKAAELLDEFQARTVTSLDCCKWRLDDLGVIDFEQTSFRDTAFGFCCSSFHPGRVTQRTNLDR
jgi:hypothetical protein